MSDLEEIAYIDESLLLYRRRLHSLRRKAAFGDASVDPNVTIQIEDILARIEGLKQRRAQLGAPVWPESLVIDTHTEVEIVLVGGGQRESVTVYGGVASANRLLDRNLLIQLRQFFDIGFSEDELRTVCFDLGIDYDNLEGKTKESKARELVAYYERKGRTAELIAFARQLRPDVPWGDAVDEDRFPERLHESDRTSTWIRKLANFLNIAHEVIIRVPANDVADALRLKLPTFAANRLFALFQADDYKLRGLNIREIRIIYRQSDYQSPKRGVNPGVYCEGEDGINIKVLIVDNDAGYLDDIARFLEVHGYDVYRAVSLEQAWHLFDYTWVHIALIDVHMRNDTDKNDTSGFLLAKDQRYRAIPKIMLTQYPSYKYDCKALGPDSEGIVPAVDFHNKNEESEAIIRVLKQTFEQRVRLNRKLTITWNQPLTFPYLVNLIQPEQDNERLLDRAGELEDLFRKLFCDSAQITIGRVLKHGAGWLLLEVFAYGDAGNEYQFVVSCGIKEQIVEESQRYERVAPQGTGVGSTVRQHSAETLRFAAIPYILIGGDLEEMVSLRTYYQSRSADLVVASMRHLYSATLPAWYHTGGEQHNGASLSELYIRGLGLDMKLLAADALRERIAAIAQRMLAAGLVSGIEIGVDTITLRFANGGTFACANPVAERYDERINPGVPALYGTIHGCIDPDSILINNAGQTWLINFTRAGQGLLLQDFIAMETAMKLEMIETLDLQARYLLEQRLLEPAKLNDTPLCQELSPELQRMALAIMQIRASAAELAGEQFTSYRVGMFFCALRYVAMFNPTLQYSRSRLIPYAHGLLLAAMLYDAG